MKDVAKARLFEDENLLARLDRMPFTKTTMGIVVLLSFVWLAEAFDIGIVGPVIKQLTTNWNLLNWQEGLLAVAGTLGVVIGMIPAGVLADKIGRRKVVIIGITWFSILTLLGSLANGYWSIISIRFLAGLGEGAVLPMPYLFLSELARPKRRAVSVGYSNGVLTAAYLLPSLAAAWALHHFSADIAWRVPFMLGGIPLLLTIPLAIWLPESPRFLLKRGRQDVVRRFVEKLEDEAGLPHDTTLINGRALAVIQKGEVQKPSTRRLFRQPYLGRGLVVLAQLTGALILFYILQVFGPTLLSTRGFGSDNAILFTGVMMGLGGVGSIVQGYLADKFGRRRVLSVYFLLAAVGSAMFGLFTNSALVLVAGFLASFFGLGVFPVSKMTVAEQYPTRLRGQGVYFVETTARVLSGVVTIYFIPFLLDLWGNQLLFEAIAIALLVLATPLLIWGRETSNISVEEAGTDLPLEKLDAELDVIGETEVTF
ncbi:MAG: MFS transporter [Alicyclobacillus sp.]|nr:MFS transporter [Alicyclobacillus sp.]